MKKQSCFIIAFIAALILASCTGTEDITGNEFTPTAESEGEEVILGILEQTGCYQGPGFNYEVTRLLDAGQYFEIIGIDDDITWIDDDITWVENIRWFQIDPDAIIDPTPPSSQVDELSPQPDPPGSQMVVRCWVNSGEVETIGDLVNLPIIQRPLLEITEETGCYAGPGMDFGALAALDAGQFFEINAIDDDITWIDDDVTWIDDDITWFRIDANAIIDPSPPHRPLNETEMILFCWVPRGSVEFSGDLIRLPVIIAQMIIPTSISDGQGDSSSQQSVSCSSYTTYQECMQHSNFGCSWNANLQVCQ